MNKKQSDRTFTRISETILVTEVIYRERNTPHYARFNLDQSV